MVKDAIETYYKKLDDIWMDRRQTHPMIPYVEKMPIDMYLGTKNDSDYIEWKLALNEQEVNFNEIAKLIGSELHPDLIEYFTSYYFLKMTGEIMDCIVTFTPITPLVNIHIFLSERKRISMEQNRDVKKIELGFGEIDGADSYLMLFDNKTGIVELFDPEKNIYIKISDSLDALIINMKPRC